MPFLPGQFRESRFYLAMGIGFRGFYMAPVGRLLSFAVCGFGMHFYFITLVCDSGVRFLKLVAGFRRCLESIGYCNNLFPVHYAGIVFVVCTLH